MGFQRSGDPYASKIYSIVKGKHNSTFKCIKQDLLAAVYMYIIVTHQNRHRLFSTHHFMTFQCPREGVKCRQYI